MTAGRTPCQWDPELFYADQADPMKTAKAVTICLTQCPITSECLAHALATKEPYGVWGGLTSAERQNLKRPKRSVQMDDGRDESVIRRLMEGDEVPDADRVDVAHALTRLWRADQGSVRGLAKRFGVGEDAARGWVQRVATGLLPTDPAWASQRRARLARLQETS